MTTLLDDGIPQLPEELLVYVGNIAHDWATLEYVACQCIWAAANLDDTLGACVTGQIFSLPPRLEALVLLLRARGASQEIIDDLNKFIADSRGPTEIRNRAVHDPLGMHTDGLPRQLQITARGRLVFELRKVEEKDLGADARKISDFIERFLALRDRIMGELKSLPYTPQPKFPNISRA